MPRHRAMCVTSLTCGQGRRQRAKRHPRVGNFYTRRKLIGALVDVQPFRSADLLGTGPKSDGPFYVSRFAAVRTVSANTAAVGKGSAKLSPLPDGQAGEQAFGFLYIDLGQLVG